MKYIIIFIVLLLIGFLFRRYTEHQENILRVLIEKIFGKLLLIIKKKNCFIGEKHTV